MAPFPAHHSPAAASEQSLLFNLVSDLGAVCPTRSPEGIVTKVFVKGPSCYKSLRKLRKEVNEDLKDDRLDAVAALAEVRAVPDHLVPLIEQHGTDDAELLLEATKLLVQLTMPDQPAAHVASCKEALTKSPMAMTVLFSQAIGPLSVDSAKRDEKSKTLLELLLWLTRNLASCRCECDAEFLCVLERERVLDICLHLAEHVRHKGNREWNLVLLEIFFHLFRAASPESLAFQKGQSGRVAAETEVAPDEPGSNKPRDVVAQQQQQQPEPDDELARLRAEKLARSSASARMLSARHSRFAVGTVYSVQTDSGAARLRSDLMPAQAPENASARSKKKALDKSALPRSVLQRPRNVDWSQSQLLHQTLTSFIESAYSPLMEALILDIRREDPRLVLADELTFVWMLGFCMRFLRLENGPGFNWVASPLFKTMDLWTFVYVVGRVEANLESKSFAALETCTGSLLEMMLVLDDVAKQGEVGKGLCNAVIYELHERLEVIHRLLKTWNPEQFSQAYLRDAVCLADVSLNIVEVMASEGALRKAKIKAAKRKEALEKKILGAPWGAEETNALYEGVKEHGSDQKALKTVLADESFAPIFAENNRSLKQLAARWEVLREHLAQGKTLESLVSEELSQEGNDAEEDGDEEGPGEHGSGDKHGSPLASAKKPSLADVQIDFFSTLRPYMQNDVFLNLTRLVDPTLAKSVRDSVVDSNAHHLVAVFYRRLRGFDSRLRRGESLEPILWCAIVPFLLQSLYELTLASRRHIEIFRVWERTLGHLRHHLRVTERHKDVPVGPVYARHLPGTANQQGTKDLVRIMDSSLRRFFRHARENPLAYAEILFWRTKGENIAMSRIYQAPQKRGEHMAVEYAEDPTLAEGEDEYVFGNAELCSHVSVESESEAEMNEDDGDDDRESEAPGKGSKVAPSSTKVFAADKAVVTKVVLAFSRSGAPLSLLTTLREWLDTASGLPRPWLGDWCFVPSSAEESEALQSRTEAMQLVLALGLVPPKRFSGGMRKLRNQHYWRLPATGASSVAAAAAALGDAVEAMLQADDVDLIASQEDGAVVIPLPSVKGCVSGAESGGEEIDLADSVSSGKATTSDSARNNKKKKKTTPAKAARSATKPSALHKRSSARKKRSARQAAMSSSSSDSVSSSGEREAGEDEPRPSRPSQEPQAEAAISKRVADDDDDEEEEELDFYRLREPQPARSPDEDADEAKGNDDDSEEEEDVKSDKASEPPNHVDNEGDGDNASVQSEQGDEPVIATKAAKSFTMRRKAAVHAQAQTLKKEKKLAVKAGAASSAKKTRVITAASSSSESGDDADGTDAPNVREEAHGSIADQPEEAKTSAAKKMRIVSDSD